MKSMVQLKVLLIFIGISFVGTILFSLPVRAVSLSAHSLQQDGANTTLPNLDLVLLIDESGSAWGTTDPEPKDQELPNRIKAALLLLNVLAVEQGRDNPSHTVSIYLFGKDVVSVVEGDHIVGNATTTGQKLVDAHRREGNLLWTDVKQGLQESLSGLKRLQTDPYRRSVVVLITDGRPETAEANILEEGKSSAQEEAEKEAVVPYLNSIVDIIGELKEVPNGQHGCPNTSVSGPLYVLAVDVQANIDPDKRYVRPEYQNFWQQPDVAGDQYRPVENFVALNGEVSRLAAELLCAAPIDLTEQRPQPTTETFSVEDNYASIIFTIITSATGSNVTITSPDGNSFQEDMDGVKVAQSSGSEVWSIRQEDFDGTWAGVWQVYVEGRGDVQFSFTKFPQNYRIKMLEPKGKDRLIAGLPVDIVGQVVNTDNTPYPGSISSFEIICKRTDGVKETPCGDLSVGRNSDGTYQTRIDRPLQGNYTIQMNAELDNEQRVELVPQEVIQIIGYPFATIIEPSESTPLYTNSEFDVEVLTGTYAETGILPIDELTAQKTKVHADLRQKDTKDVVATKSLDFDRTDPNVTHVTTMTSPTEPGSYEIVVRIEYETGDGEIISNESVGAINLREAPTATSIPAPTQTPTVPLTPSVPGERNFNPWALLGGLGFLSLGTLGFYISRLPKLNGAMLRPKGGIGMQPIVLSGIRRTIPIQNKVGEKALLRFFRRRTDSGVETVARVVKLPGGANLRIDGVPMQTGDEAILSRGKSIEMSDGDSFEFSD